MRILCFSLYFLIATVCASAAARSAAPFLPVGNCAARNTPDISASPALPTQQTETPQPSADSPSDVISKKLIPEFAEITPTLYRGAQPRKHGLEALAKMGI